MKKLSVIIAVLVLLLGGVSCDENGVGPTPPSDTTQPPPTDTTSPLITNVSAQEISETTVTITWTTNELATSQVEYGKTTDYGLTTTFKEEFVTTHSVSLTDLTPNTSYHYRVRSKDTSNNEAISGEHTFTTTSSVTGQLLVYFIDVGQGDSILVDLGEVEVLIDGGGKSSGVISYLNDYVDGALEVMVATHPHADHIGGLISVLGEFEVQEIWHNGDTNGSQTYAEFMATTLAGTTNNNSIVLSLSCGEIVFLITGDAEREAESIMLGAGIVPDVEVLKVGHHGSRTSSSQAFLATAVPEVAIYMAGEGNRYGHPHEETITALTELGVEIYGTDINGTIIVTTNGTTYNVLPAVPAGTSDTTHDLTISVDGQGTTNPSPGIHTYDEGTPVTITATPASGWSFDYWGGDASGTNTSVSITMNSNKLVTAYFKQVTGVGSNVQITYIFYDGLVRSVESDEYVEITNLGDEPQDLAGWVLKDISEGYPSFTFPSYILAPGVSIRVYTNEIHPECGGFSFGYGKAIWNNTDPDVAALYDPQGQEVSRKSY